MTSRRIEEKLTYHGLDYNFTINSQELAHSYSNHLIIDKYYNGYWFQAKMEVNISHWNLQDMIAILKIKDVFLVMEWKMKHCM